MFSQASEEAKSAGFCSKSSSERGSGWWAFLPFLRYDQAEVEEQVRMLLSQGRGVPEHFDRGLWKSGQCAAFVRIWIWLNTKASSEKREAWGALIDELMRLNASSSDKQIHSVLFRMMRFYNQASLQDSASYGVYKVLDSKTLRLYSGHGLLSIGIRYLKHGHILGALVEGDKAYIYDSNLNVKEPVEVTDEGVKVVLDHYVEHYGPASFYTVSSIEKPLEVPEITWGQLAEFFVDNDTAAALLSCAIELSATNSGARKVLQLISDNTSVERRMAILNTPRSRHGATVWMYLSYLNDREAAITSARILLQGFAREQKAILGDTATSVKMTSAEARLPFATPLKPESQPELRPVAAATGPGTLSPPTSAAASSAVGVPVAPPLVPSLLLFATVCGIRLETCSAADKVEWSCPVPRESPWLCYANPKLAELLLGPEEAPKKT